MEMAKRYCILSYKVLILAIICCFINANAQAAPILKLNSHGHDVIVLQQNLIRMNYDLSKVSGNYDKETQEAVKAFQKDHKIKVTGIVNRETWWAIKGGKQNVIVNSQSSINEKIILACRMCLAEIHQQVLIALVIWNMFLLNMEFAYLARQMNNIN